MVKSNSERIQGALSKLGFKVSIRSGNGREMQLWSIRGNGVVKNNLTHQEAREFLEDWRASH